MNIKTNNDILLVDVFWVNPAQIPQMFHDSWGYTPWKLTVSTYGGGWFRCFSFEHGVTFKVVQPLNFQGYSILVNDEQTL